MVRYMRKSPPQLRKCQWNKDFLHFTALAKTFQGLPQGHTTEWGRRAIAVPPVATLPRVPAGRRAGAMTRRIERLGGAPLCPACRARAGDRPGGVPGRGRAAASRRGGRQTAKSDRHRAGNRRGLGKADGTSITPWYGVTLRSHRLTLPSHDPPATGRPWPWPAGPGPGQAPAPGTTASGRAMLPR
jgi:hypothetical protein